MVLDEKMRFPGCTFIILRSIILPDDNLAHGTLGGDFLFIG